MEIRFENSIWTLTLEIKFGDSKTGGEFLLMTIESLSVKGVRWIVKNMMHCSVSFMAVFRIRYSHWMLGVQPNYSGKRNTANSCTEMSMNI